MTLDVLHNWVIYRKIAKAFLLSILLEGLFSKADIEKQFHPDVILFKMLVIEYNVAELYVRDLSLLILIEIDNVLNLLVLFIVSFL